MVRASKSSVTNTSASVVSTPVVASAPAVTASKASKKSKSVEAVAPASTPSSVPVVNSLAPAVEVSTDNSNIPNKMTEFNAKLQQLISLFSSIKNDFKALEKVVTREMKNAQKLSSKKRRNNGNRKPSGFIKPTRISDELAQFLEKSIGSEMARTEVSKEINAYIQKHGLQDKSNGRKINPDAKLTQLLKITKDDELTYFNLQKFMKHHFIKSEELAAVETSTSVTA
jgi:chromatin remodeling complex protein RSC6